MAARPPSTSDFINTHTDGGAMFAYCEYFIEQMTSLGAICVSQNVYAREGFLRERQKINQRKVAARVQTLLLSVLCALGAILFVHYACAQHR
jgi:hypothetical protein